MLLIILFTTYRTVINFGLALIVTLCGLAIIAAVSFGIP